MWTFRVADIGCGKAEQAKTNPMLDFTLAQVVQRLRPRGKLAQHFGAVTRNQNMPRIAAVHHPLRDIDAAARYILRFAASLARDGAAVNTHAQLQMWMPFPQRAGDLQGALRRGKRIARKHQRQPVAQIVLKQFAALSGANTLRRGLRDVPQFASKACLLLDGAQRIAHYIHEQHMHHFGLYAGQIIRHIPVSSCEIIHIGVQVFRYSGVQDNTKAPHLISRSKAIIQIPEHRHVHFSVSINSESEVAVIAR